MTMEVHEIPQWNSLRKARACLGDWKLMLGEHYASVRPLLVKCVGELAKSYPDPDTGLRLRVRELNGGYVAHPVGDFEADSRDYLLTEDDLQVWCLGAGQGRKAESDDDISNLELKKHFDGRFDSLGRDYAKLQSENKALKQDLGQLLANIARKVDPIFFRGVFTVLGVGSVSGAAKVLGLANATFDGQLKAFAKRGGLYKTLFDMVGVRRKLGVKKVERFNDLFAGHQPQDLGNAKFMTDLLDGLEALNEKNWAVVRDELMDLVQNGIP